MKSTLNLSALTHTAITALKDAYEECTSIEAKHSIATAYTAITLMNFVSGRSDSYDSIADIDDGFDPSEYCAAI